MEDQEKLFAKTSSEATKSLVSRAVSEKKNKIKDIPSMSCSHKFRSFKSLFGFERRVIK